MNDKLLGVLHSSIVCEKHVYNQQVNIRIIIKPPLSPSIRNEKSGR